MSFLHLRLLTVVLCSLCVLVHTGEVHVGGFSPIYSMTGCVKDPTEGCGRGGTDICYRDRSNSYAITGTAPMCNGCMPKNYLNIFKYVYPVNLPCAIWSVYKCDDLFVNHVWYKSGSNSCFLGGRKSYNIENTFGSAQEAEERFIKQCRQEKTLADYGLPPDTKLITEPEFCPFQLNNITNIIMPGEGGEVIVYKEYYEKKFNVKVKSAATD